MDVRLVKVLWIFFTISTIWSVCTGCRYPEFVQSRVDGVPRREWHTHVMENSQRVSIVSFHESVMREEVQHSKGPRTTSFSRECLLQTEGRYLSKHRLADNGEDLFVCLEFVQRSDDVVQVRLSRFSENETSELCDDDEMTLDDWPMINRVNFFNSYQVCPLKGGYNMVMYDRRQKTGVCDSYHGETRLESECMKGEGLVFLFRSSVCVPAGLAMDITQHVYCTASWSIGRQTWVVLRHDTLEKVWCLQYEISSDGSLNAHLSRDLVCEAARNRAFKTNNTLWLQLTPNTGAQELCVDDYEACDYWSNPCSRISATTAMRLTCARTCSECIPGIRPGSCSLPSQLHGQWTESSKNGDDTISIGNTTVGINRIGIFQCVQWNGESSSELTESSTKLDGDEEIWERMFVTTSINGCRPRYHCVQFKKNASSVLRYRLSQSQIWPFEGLKSGDSANCGLFRYQNDNEPFGTTYRSRNFKITVAADPKKKKVPTATLR